VTDPRGKTWQTHYDADGRIDTITDWASRTTNLAYDNASRITTLTQPGGVVTSYGYDELDRLTSATTTHATDTLLDLGYGYDADGNLTSYTDDTGTASFTYDDLNRLIAATYPGSQSYGYTYDAVGNLTQAVTPSGTTNYTYDAANRISNAGFVYDDNGSLTSDGTRTFTYDALDRLTGVSTPATTETFALDGDGNRLSETVNGSTTPFDLDLRGTPTVLGDGSRLYLPGLPGLGYDESGTWQSTLTDVHGSVLGSVSTTGTLGTLVHYDPYGGARPGSTLGSGIGWTGEWTDPTGLVNLRARTYDPSLGRFLSADTFGGSPADPASAHRFAFGADNPLTAVDPSGHFVNHLYEPATLALDFAIQSLPVVGDAYTFVTGAIGYDPILNVSLSSEERLLAMGSAFLVGPGLHLLDRLGGLHLEPNAILTLDARWQVAQRFLVGMCRSRTARSVRAQTHGSCR
jgi:RHS repeat-associated protein